MKKTTVKIELSSAIRGKIFIDDFEVPNVRCFYIKGGMDEVPTISLEFLADKVEFSAPSGVTEILK